jgi:hypothetical protein
MTSNIHKKQNYCPKKEEYSSEVDKLTQTILSEDLGCGLGEENWIYQYKTVHIYDPSEIVTSQFIGGYYTWHQGDWRISISGAFTSSETGDTSIYIAQNWDNSKAAWINSSKNWFHKDESGIILTEGFVWNVDGEIWGRTTMEEMQYDDNNQSLLYASYSWDETAMRWNSGWKYTIVYDPDGKLVDFYDYDWDVDEQTWAIDDKLTWEYSWNESSQAWQLGWKYIYYYDPTLGIPSKELPSMNMFPNPSDGTIYLKGDAEITRAELYSLNGIKMADYSIGIYENCIRLNEIDKGMYLFILTDKHYNRYSRKIIIE